MELPASLREINPVLDQIARSGRPPLGADLRLAAALGLVTPGGELTGAGRAYACPALAGPSALVMTPSRRAALVPLISTGTLPLQRTLRRLLRLIAGVGRRLVAPAELELEWPEALLRPYLAYLEDLGLLLPIGPLVEVTPEGRSAAAAPEPLLPRWAPWVPEARGPQAPSFQSAAFRYHLVRRVCMDLLVLRGRREWHHLQPLLEGPFAPLEPAFSEWLGRFRESQPAVRRTWSPDLVARFEAQFPCPAWFPVWTRALLNAEPEQAVEALARTPFLLQDPAVVTGGDLPTREAWLVAAALGWAARRGRGLVYEAAAARLSLDGIALPPRAEMLTTLETAGLLVASRPGPDFHLLLPVVIQPHAEAIWPYPGPDWLAAALLEGHAFSRQARPRSVSKE